MQWKLVSTREFQGSAQGIADRQTYKRTYCPTYLVVITHALDVDPVIPDQPIEHDPHHLSHQESFSSSFIGLYELSTIKPQLGRLIQGILKTSDGIGVAILS